MIICLPEAYLRIWPSVMISRGKNSVDRPAEQARVRVPKLGGAEAAAALSK